ncbi:MAG TPA: AbrB/MazE/SpoVT family DNA-binding domain-containing protein [Nitrososphaeraceae archaeon]|jgi:bifunctional DNA-binding transcriptional regulator/antitoxin component of YhaV-PrlF toxin-antitoxin module
MTEDIEIRRVQAYSGERSMTIVLPKIFSEKLGIGKGDFLKVQLDNSRLILEKADL